MSLIRVLTATALSTLLAGPAFAQTPPAPQPPAEPMPPMSAPMATPMPPMADPSAPAVILQSSPTPPERAWTLKAGDPHVVTNGPVPDTAENRAKYGQPMSNGGQRTKPVGN